MKYEIKKWICDTCGELIEKPEDGYAAFKMNNNMYEEFYIIHKTPASPRPNGCLIGGYYSLEEELKYYLGATGIAKLLSMIDRGSHIDEDNNKSYVSNMRNWVNFFRRLHNPYYEEARSKMNLAMSQGILSGFHSEEHFRPHILKGLLEELNDDYS